MESSQEETETKLESLIENFDLKQRVLIRESLLEVAELHWKEAKNELEGVSTEEKLKRDERSPEFLAFKIEFMRGKAKVKCLLEEMKSVQDEGKLESQRWKMRLGENIQKAEFILQEMKSMLEEGLRTPGLEMQLEEQIAKSELLLEEMELVGGERIEKGIGEEQFPVVKNVKDPVLNLQLKEHIVKVESLLGNVKIVQEESKIESPMLGIQLMQATEELQFLLKEMQLAQISGNVECSGVEIVVEYIMKLNLLLDGTDWEKEKDRMRSLRVEIDELPRGMTIIFEKSGRRKIHHELPILSDLSNIIHLLLKMKSERKGEELGPRVELEQKEKEEPATKSKSLQEIMKSVQESNIKSPALGMQLKKCIVELDGELKKKKLEIVKEKLKFRELKIKLYSYMVELDPLLEKIKLEEDEEGKRFRALKMELNEDITKLELVREETVLEERHVAELKEFIAKAKKINLVREESTMESLMLQLKESTVELKSLLEKMELMGSSVDCERYIVKLKFLLGGIEFKQKEQALHSKALEIQLEERIVKIEMLVKELESARDVNILELKEHLGIVKSLLEATKLERDEGKLEFPALEVQVKKHIMQIRKPWKIELFEEALALEKQIKERIIELKSLQEKNELAQFIGKLYMYESLKMELNRHAMKLKSLLDETEYEKVRSSPALKLQYHMQESESLLKEIASEPHVGILQPLVWKMVLERNSAKGKSLLAEDIKLKQKKFSTLKIELKRHIAELESQLLKMKLEQEEEGLASEALELEFVEHIVKSELLLEEIELISDPDILMSTVSKIQFGEHLEKLKFRLATMKLGREERKLLSARLEKKLKEHIMNLNSVLMQMKSQRKELEMKSSALDVKLEEHIVNLEDLLEETKVKPEKEKLEPSPKKIRLEQEGKVALSIVERSSLTSLIAFRPLIVIGGRGQDGQSLRSVEGYIFLEERWIALPAMNIPRSFMSSVVVDNEIIVSGGDTGDAITDTIEVLNLAETPLQWRMSPAKLPVPLSAHQTVVYRGNLIVIGGHDFNEGKNSDTIYEVLLTPPYTSRFLRFMFIPVAWHGAELVGDEVFIFGGGRSHSVTTSNVFVYNLVRNTLNERQSLPRALKGMATVRQEQSVAVIGGLDLNDQELDNVFMYDTNSEERRSLPQMSEERGGCSAAISFAFDTGGFTDALFVLGSVRSVSTVEGFSFGSHRWIDMSPTREARGFCSMVIAPIELPLE